MTEIMRTLSVRTIVQMVLVVFVAPFIPMIVSGIWNWSEAWLYALASILAFALSRVIAGRRHPDLIAERGRFMEAKDTKPWDRVLAPLLGIGWILILVVAGLDKFYGRSSAFSPGIKLIAFVMIFLGYAISSWALIENRFFSGTVRIQTERGHHVVSTGPYRFVRHPGYSGGLLTYLFTPLVFDSTWAFIPAFLLEVIMVIRTALEDETLRAELPGYEEFTKKTRYRLIPGIW